MTNNVKQEEHIHSFMFDGDDPYVICSCGKRIDNLTGKELVASAMQAAEQEVERMFTQADVNQQVIQALERAKQGSMLLYLVEPDSGYPQTYARTNATTVQVIDNLIEEYKGDKG